MMATTNNDEGNDVLLSIFIALEMWALGSSVNLVATTTFIRPRVKSTSGVLHYFLRVSIDSMSMKHAVIVSGRYPNANMSTFGLLPIDMRVSTAYHY